MSNEISIPGRGVVLAELEVTYNTDPGPLAANVAYVEDFSADYEVDMKPRSGPQPETNGLMAVPIGGHVSWALTSEIAPQTITDGGVSQNPNVDAFLQCSGFSRHGDSATDSITYVLRTAEHGSVSIYAQEGNSDNSDANQIKIVGGRADFTIDITPQALMTLSLTGMGVAQALTGVAATEVDNVIKETGAALTAVTYSADKPLVSNGFVATFSDVETGNIYGGGTVATSATGALLVKSCQIKGNWTVVEQTGVSGAQGVGRIFLQLPAGSFHTMSLVIEATNLSDFNPYLMRQNTTPVEVNLKALQPGAPGNTTQIVAYCQIAGITKGEDTESTRTWELELNMIYPPAADETVAAGIDPAQTIAEGSAVSPKIFGVLLDPAVALPATKLVIQFATA